jgi:hypothetical protein
MATRRLDTYRPVRLTEKFDELQVKGMLNLAFSSLFLLE